MDNSICFGKIIEGYYSFSNALSTCRKDSNCKGIVDVNCDSDMFWTCGGEFGLGLGQWEKKSCSWKKSIKSNLSFRVHYSRKCFILYVMQCFKSLICDS